MSVSFNSISIWCCNTFFQVYSITCQEMSINLAFPLIFKRFYLLGNYSYNHIFKTIEHQTYDKGLLKVYKSDMVFLITLTAPSFLASIPICLIF